MPQFLGQSPCRDTFSWWHCHSFWMCQVNLPKPTCNGRRNRILGVREIFFPRWLVAEIASVLASPGWLPNNLRSISQRLGALPVCHPFLQRRPLWHSTIFVRTHSGCCCHVRLWERIYFLVLKKLRANLLKPLAYCLFPLPPSPRVHFGPTLPRSSWRSCGRSILLQMLEGPTVPHIAAPQCRALPVTHTLIMSPTLHQTKETFFLKARTSSAGGSGHSGFSQTLTMPESTQRRVPLFNFCSSTCTLCHP